MFETAGHLSGAKAGFAAPVDVEGRRDARLDVFRGLALVMIYINHVPGTVFENFTSRNWGFSDAAEGFVIMSGIAAGLAYSSGMRSHPWQATRRIGLRVWTLYTVHIVTTMVAIGISASAALWFGATRMIEINNLAAFFERPLGVMVGLPTLGHQLGYFNILPLYMVLLLAAPGMILIGLRRPLVLVALSVALWAAAGTFRLNLPNFPNPGGWFFNPLSWQLIFVVGLLTGIAMRQGRRLVPVDRLLLPVAGAFLLYVLAWRLVPAIGDAGRNAVAAGYRVGLPFYIAGFDKTFLALPRALHALALLYVVSAIPGLRRASAAAWAAPLALMGRFGLPVFATGSVLSILGQSIKAAAAPGLALDAAVIFGGLAVQLLAAWLFSRTRRESTAVRTAPADLNGPPPG